MKSPVLHSKEDFYKWVARFEKQWSIQYVMPHEMSWLLCIAILIPGEQGCAEIVWVYYHEFQTARYQIEEGA